MNLHPVHMFFKGSFSQIIKVKPCGIWPCSFGPRPTTMEMNGIWLVVLKALKRLKIKNDIQQNLFSSLFPEHAVNMFLGTYYSIQNCFKFGLTLSQEKYISMPMYIKCPWFVLNK